ncbi:hypothetical protein HYV82_05890, partial [Candidatus Woesearchaeota archaeon]|nr:hypothetical protein [Candidatus Woesearchaeota archaeon]
MNGKNAPAIFASALAALLMMLMLLILAGLAFAGLPTVYHPAGDIMPGNFSEGGYSFPNASRVGIGTPSPGYTLDVIGNVGSQYHGLSGLAGGNGIFIEATDGSAGYGSRLRYGGNGTNADTFQIQGVGNAVKLHISPQGNVGIGTISSDAKLTIQSAATGSGLHIRAAENPPDYMLKVEDQDGSVQGMYIDDLGRVGIGTTTPNATLQINKTGAVTNSCGGNWINDASAIMFRQNPGGGCGDDAYIAYYTTAS